MNINWEKDQDVVDALIALYVRQTPQEQSSHATVEDNGVGFNAVDAPFLTSISEQLFKERFITEKQLAILRNVLRKYSGQISEAEDVTIQNIKFVGTKVYKRDGLLKINDDSLVFVPDIYPTVAMNDLGFEWKKGIGWVGFLSRNKIEDVMHLFSNTQLDDTVTEWLDNTEEGITVPEALKHTQLMDFQQEASAFIMKAKRAILALAPGLGKTIASVIAAEELNLERILIVAPLSLVINWQIEVDKWKNKPTIFWHGSIDNWEAYEKWVVTNYDTVSRNLDDLINQKFDLIIIDESILVKNRGSRMVKGKLKVVVQRTDSVKKLCKNPEYVWLLSGAPTSKFLNDMWAQLNILYPKRFSSYWKFCERYCIVEKDHWGTKIVGNQPGAIERLKRDIEDIYYSKTQADVTDIPDWIFEALNITMSDKQFKYYDQMEREFLADLPDGDQVIAPIVLTQMLRLAQIASNPLLIEGADCGAKWDAVEELLEFIEKPAIVWTYYIKTAELMQERLQRKYRVGILTGNVKSAQERQNTISSFQRGELEVLIAHPAVGKFGHTLTAARTAIYMERWFSGDDYYQSLYRIKRIGTSQSPYVINLLAARPDGAHGTIDHVIHRVLEFSKDGSIALTTGLIRDLLKQKGGS